MKTVKILALILLTAPILYVAHVPVLRYISTATAPSLEEYPPIGPYFESENFEMVQTPLSGLYQMWFDNENQQFIALGSHQSSDTEQVITLDLRGEVVAVRPREQQEYKKYEGNEQYTPISILPRQEFGVAYDLDELRGMVELAHFQFETFTWPYMFYFIPVITLNWTGTAFVDVPVDDGVMKFSIPTDLKGNWAYLNAHVELEIDVFRLESAAPDVRFIQIGETYYLSGFDGEIHRDGIGFYVVRPK